MMAGWLMSPDWTSGDMFGIRPLLHSLWVIIANVTYFIYAILLIFIALGTIFNSDKYGYKQLLPRLALGIMLVPLTWWFIQFIISLSSIMTASVMNIPMETLMNKTQDSATPGWYKDKLIPNRIEYINDGTKEPKRIDCKDTPDKCMNAQEVLGKAGGIYSPLLIYGYAIFKVQDIKSLDKWSDKINTPFQIVHQIIF